MRIFKDLKSITKDNRYFIEYQKIRAETLRFYEKFKENHPDIMCKKGCTDCCEPFSILPVEYYYLKNVLKNEQKIKIANNSSRCKFLIENECKIYQYRPIMCITQGLPLFLREGTNKRGEIIICKKNSGLISKKSKNIKIFEYDILIAKISILNELFCEEYKTRNNRINIMDI